MGILSTAGTAIAGLAGAGAGIAGTVGSAVSNRNTAQLNNAFNERMLQKQMDYNTEMYERQLGDQWKMYEDAKEYNSAGAQRERLEAAGLNAGLLMSGQNAGSIQSMNAPAAQGINPPRGSAIPTDYSGLGQIVGDSVAAASMLSDKRKTDAETFQVYIENQFRGAKLLAELGEILSRTKNMEARTLTENLMRSLNADLTRSQIGLTRQQQQTEYFDTQLRSVQVTTAEQQLAFLPIQQRLEIASQLSSIALQRSQKRLTDKQVEHEVKRIAETVARTDAQTLENDFNRETYDARSETVRNNAGPKDATGLFNVLYSILNKIAPKY